MSRIGKLPITIPANVKFAVDGGSVKVEGPKGALEKAFNPSVVEITFDDGTVTVAPVGKSRLAKAMHGTARSIIQGMVEGVVQGYKKNLTISGVGFRANVNGKFLKLELGYSHDINHPIPDGLTVTVTDQTKLAVEGPDKQMVGQFAAQVKKFYPVEPYKGKGVTIVGEYVRRKEGKKAG
jgi:large subunit ribosomal protein L6